MGNLPPRDLVFTLPRSYPDWGSGGLPPVHSSGKAGDRISPLFQISGQALALSPQFHRAHLTGFRTNKVGPVETRTQNREEEKNRTEQTRKRNRENPGIIYSYRTGSSILV